MISSIEIRKSPFVKIVIPFIIGVWVLSAIDIRSLQLAVIGILLVVCTTLMIFNKVYSKHSAWFSGLFIYLVMALAGMGIYSINVFHSSIPEDELLYTGIVCRMPVGNNKSVSIDCMLTQYYNRERKVSIKEKVRLYLPADTEILLPQPGDSISFKSSLRPVRNSGNPGEFDFVKHMFNLGIVYSGFVQKDNLIVGNISRRYISRRLAAKAQMRIISIINEYKIEGNELAVLSALVAGNRQFIDGELKENYAAAGVMHILAVSGLHVGILYLFLSIILFRNNNRPVSKILRMLLILNAIWGYAFITGLSSSVLRASVMFSLFLVGKSFNRPVNSYNILAASALIILIINPLQLFRVGFQFSYLAVFGIIFFQPRIERLITIRNSLLDRIWQLITVSIAAQLMTFPLSLYYFHQFPVYFWLSNIIVIPVVWLIMVIALLFFLFSSVVPIASFLSLILKGSLLFLNKAIEIIALIPASIIENIRFEGIHLIAFFIALMILILIGSRYRVKRNIPLLISIPLILLVIDIAGHHVRETKRELLIYNAGNTIAMSIIDGHEHILLVDKSNDNWVKNKEYLKNYWINRDIHRNMCEIDLELIPVNEFGCSFRDISIVKFPASVYILFNDMTLFLPTNSRLNSSRGYEQQYQPDIIIVSRNSGYPDITRIQSVAPAKIIIAGSLKGRIQRAWKEYADERMLEIHSLYISGALHEIY